MGFNSGFKGLKYLKLDIYTQVVQILLYMYTNTHTHTHTCEQQKIMCEPAIG